MTEKIYQDKIAAYKAVESSLKSRSRIWLLGKIISFTLIVVFGWLAYNDYSAVYVFNVFIFACIYLFSYIADEKCMTKIESCRAMQNVCRNEIKYLNGDFSPFPNGENFVNPNHEFSYDLDIFGKSSLYNRINRTVTGNGSKRLAEKLSAICNDKKEILENQEASAELAAMPDFRIALAANPYIEARSENPEDLVGKDGGKNIFIRTGLPYILTGITLLTLVLNIAGMLPVGAFVFMFLLQLGITAVVDKISLKTSSQTEMFHKEFGGYIRILNKISKQDFKSEKMKRISGELFSGSGNSLEALRKLARIINLFDQRGNAVMYILLNGLFLFDILVVKMFFRWSKKYLPHVRQWIDSIAEIDALSSLATYAFNNPQNRYGEILDEDSEYVFDAVNVCHPFIPHDKAVPNSFSLKKKNISIVTGANMAGKSTFLRTVGVTYILASCGAPVCAESFRFSLITLFSSMRTTDDLSSDISYFNAELLRLKKLIQHVKSSHFTLIILDEILKGTNSQDKLKGSVMFLEEISKFNLAAVIATHDLELAKLEEKSPVYSNYRFEIELSEDIKYTYKIQKGVAQNLNATFLLSNILKSI